MSPHPTPPHLTYVSILGSRETTVRALGPPQTELQQLDVLPSSNAVAGGVGGHEGGEVDEGEEGGLQQLDHNQGPRDPHQGNPGEHHRALRHGVDADVLGAELLQELVELLLHRGRHDRPQVGDVGLAVVEVLQQLDAVPQAGEDGELSFEGVFPKSSLSSVSGRVLVCGLKLPEVKIKRCHIVSLPGLPISVGHRDLERGSDVQEGERERLTW